MNSKLISLMGEHCLELATSLQVLAIRDYVVNLCERSTTFSCIVLYFPHQFLNEAIRSINIFLIQDTLYSIIETWKGGYQCIVTYKICMYMLLRAMVTVRLFSNKFPTYVCTTLVTIAFVFYFFYVYSIYA